MAHPGGGALTKNNAVAKQKRKQGFRFLEGNGHKLKGQGIDMKTTIKLAVMGALMAIGVAHTNAATTPKTIWVQHLNFKLTAWEDGNPKAVKIATKDIINDLSGLPTPIGGVTNPVFSTGSQLITKQDTASTNGDTQIIMVRDTKTKIDTDVSEFFEVGGTASASFTTGAKTTSHSITTFTLNGVTPLSFTLSGFTTESRGTENGVEVTKSASANVAGTGTVSTTDAVIQGTVSLAGGKLEAAP
ncbi:MAG TPA: hypothetical protein VK475_03575 [Pyrinomonadaceae bacterium]|nr:hypothetical protein [Pyrinomonadaceae bacterium]